MMPCLKKSMIWKMIMENEEAHAQYRGKGWEDERMKEQREVDGRGRKT